MQLYGWKTNYWVTHLCFYAAKQSFHSYTLDIDFTYKNIKQTKFTEIVYQNLMRYLFKRVKIAPVMAEYAV